MKRPAEKPDWVDILLAATLVAWGTLVVAMILFFMAPGIIASPESAVPQVLWYLGISLLGFLLATIACTVVGLPALALARWLKLTEWWQAAIVGGLAGLGIIYPIISQSHTGLHGPIEIVSLWLFCFALAGALAGVAAWRERRKGMKQQ